MKKILALIFSGILSFSILACSNNNKNNQSTKTQNTKSYETTQTSSNTTNVPISQSTVTTSVASPSPSTPPPTGKVKQLTDKEFRDLVFDYTKSTQWHYKGSKPCIIDFYADWCGPCRMVSPIMDQLAKEYKGQIYFYRVNVDQERRLAQIFQIRSIPAVLFCPVKGQPQMAIGAMPKQAYVRAIQQIFGINQSK
jgi:thioredoxin